MKTPSVLYQNYLRELWCTVVVEDLNLSTDDSKARSLKEFIIKFTVKSDQTPLTLDYKTFYETTGLDYNKGDYVAYPSLEVVKAELAKITINEALVLGGNHSSIEQLNLTQQLIVFSLLTRTKIDIGEIILSDLVTMLMVKSRQRYISYLIFVSCALEELLGSNYPLDQKFGNLPNVLSQTNFTKNPSKVTPVELMALMIDSHDPKASGAHSHKEKKSKTKKTFLVKTTIKPTKEKVPTETIGTSQSVSSGQTTDPQDTKGDIQPAIKGLPTTLDEGTRSSKHFLKGKPTDAKDPRGNKQPTGMGSRFTHPDDVELDFEPLILTTVGDIQALLGDSEDE
ncbi:hypothetical protein Tco_1108387 [Tanacetum coccineum]